MEPKTKKSVRTIPMLDEVYDALKEQKRRQDLEKKKNELIYEDQGFVFANEVGNYLPQRPFMEHYHQFLKKYKITNIRFHDLRHTFATLLIELIIGILSIYFSIVDYSNVYGPLAALVMLMFSIAVCSEAIYFGMYVIF